MEISIIIPVFNAEKYLDRCLLSVVDSLRNAGSRGEIVLVDNLSTDGSLKIAKKWQKKLSCEKALALRVVECQTPGAAAAKNAGVREAKGKYIWFVDADDTIAETAVARILKVTKMAGSMRLGEAKMTVDLIMIGATRVYADGHTDYLSAVKPDEPNWESRFVRYGMGPWQVVVRRAWWNKHHIAFREGIIHEDMELMSALILYPRQIYFAVDEPLYFYYQNENSVLHRRVWSEHAYDIFPALEGLLERFRSFQAEKQYHDELEWFFIWNLLIDSAKDFAEFPEGHAGFSRSREMLMKYFPGWGHNRFLQKKPLRLRMRVLMNYYKH